MTSPYSHLIKLYQLLALQGYADEKDKLEKSILAKKVTMSKFSPGSCCVCRNTANLRNIHHKYIYEDEIDDYVEMFLTCFNVEILDEEKNGELCEPCVIRLKDAAQFRKLVEAAVESQQQEIDTEMSLKNDQQNDWLKTIGNEPWRKKCGNRTVFCTRGLKKPPAANSKPTLPRDSTVCPICNVVFDSHFSLVRHHSSHYLNYICTICGRGYHKVNNYKRHMELHENRRYPCEMCSKTYSNRNALRQHIQIYHNKIKIYRCRKCSERFSASSTRQKHMFEKHGVNCRRFACVECGKIFFTIQHHNSHVKRTHLNLKDHLCPECDSSFHTASELKLHLLKHTDIRKFACEQCGKMFKMRKSLIEHLNLHSSIRKYKCQLCDADFTQRASLSSHMKTHRERLDAEPLSPTHSQADYTSELYFITQYDSNDFSIG